MSEEQAKIPPIPTVNPQTDFATSRTLAAPVEDVWRAFTEGEHLKQWWGPTGFTCPVAEMDVRRDGVSLVAMQAPPEMGGTTFYNTWTYSVVMPQQRLDYVVRFSDKDRNHHHPSELGLPPGIPAEVPHLVIFAGTRDGGTLLTLVEYGYESPSAIDMSRQGLEQCLDKLEAYLAALAANRK